MSELTLQQAYDLALQQHRAGNLAEAETLYRQILSAAPEQPETLHYYGVLCYQWGRVAEALALIDRALALQPEWTEALSNRGEMLRASGRREEALATFQRALALQPDLAAARHNLGVTLYELGRLDEALPELHQALQLQPDDAAIHVSLGNVLQAQGQADAAAAAYQQAIALQPNSADAYNNLGNVHYALGQHAQAVALYDQAVALQPGNSALHLNRGNALQDQGQLDAAIAAYHQALALQPANALAYNNLGNAMKSQGLLDEALAAYRQAVELNPDDVNPQSALLLTPYYHPGWSAAEISAAQRAWSRRFAEPLLRSSLPHSNSREPERRLRIGYVSADFWDHPLGWFLLPLLEQHDRERYEIVVYAQVTRPDALTARLRAATSAWRNLVGLSNEQAADLIRRDQIDILVDLSMHAAHNRALVFARKPAPVQVNYLAYAGSSGMPQMDYRLSDAWLDPSGEDESIYSEKTLRLAGSYWCYRPSVKLEISPPPFQTTGQLTFGCLNNFCKLNPPLLELWAELLREVPNARLLLHAASGSHRHRVWDFFESAQVRAERIEFVGRLPLLEYFELYQAMDIALDTTPFGGGTTNCDALWMGVPVVTLAGRLAVGRGGVSLLQNLGLPELIARTSEEYVQIAAALANDRARLQDLRATLRARMEASPLMKERSYARSIEDAYRQMWRAWCAK